MTQPGETDGYKASDHVRAIIDHAGQGIIDYALIHRGRVPPALEEKYRRTGQHPVRRTCAPCGPRAFSPLRAPW